MMDMQENASPRNSRIWLPLLVDGTLRIVQRDTRHHQFVAVDKAYDLRSYPTPRPPTCSGWIFDQFEPHIESFTGIDGHLSWRLSDAGRAWLATKKPIKGAKVVPATQETT
jgi:hypothetical protein